MEFLYEIFEMDDNHPNLYIKLCLRSFQKQEEFFLFQSQNKKLKIYSKHFLINFIGLCRLISTLKHSIPSKVVKVMSFILWAMKVENTYKVVF